MPWLDRSFVLSLRAMKQCRAIRKKSVSKLDRMSKCTVRVVRHLNSRPNLLSCRQPTFTVKGPKQSMPVENNGGFSSRSLEGGRVCHPRHSWSGSPPWWWLTASRPCRIQYLRCSSAKRLDGEAPCLHPWWRAGSLCLRSRTTGWMASDSSCSLQRSLPSTQMSLTVSSYSGADTGLPALNRWNSSTKLSCWIGLCQFYDGGELVCVWQKRGLGSHGEAASSVSPVGNWVGQMSDDCRRKARHWLLCIKISLHKNCLPCAKHKLT